MMRSGLSIRSYHHRASPKFVCACACMRDGSRPRHARRLWRVHVEFAGMHDLYSVFLPIHVHHLRLSRPTGLRDPLLWPALHLCVARVTVAWSRHGIRASCISSHPAVSCKRSIDETNYRSSPVAQRQSIRLLTEGLLVRI